MDGHRTVIVLGAGASFASDHHLPTMAAFWPTLSGLADPLQRFLIWFGAAKTQPCNLEEVLAYLDLARHRSGTWGLPTTPAGTDPEQCYAAVLDDLRARLATPSDRPCASHVKLFQRLEPEDSVITLNYDLIADSVRRITSRRNRPAAKRPARKSRTTCRGAKLLWRGSPVTVATGDRNWFLSKAPWIIRLAEVHDAELSQQSTALRCRGGEAR
jgi:hypothetical protein